MFEFEKNTVILKGNITRSEMGQKKTKLKLEVYYVLFEILQKGLGKWRPICKLKYMYASPRSVF